MGNNSRSDFAVHLKMQSFSGNPWREVLERNSFVRLYMNCAHIDKATGRVVMGKRPRALKEQKRG